MKTIAIVGAGASGLMCAASILENSLGKDFHIHLFEKNSIPGKKVLISGGGRCNITTGIEEKNILSTKYVRGWEFIRKSFGKFGPKKVYEWFESHGVPLKKEEDMRVFPVSDDGHDVVGVFREIFSQNPQKITEHYREGVSSVERNGSQYIVKTEKGIYEVDFLVITTGGNAYSHTGSTGDGYAFARSFGHTVSKLGPSLSSFLTKETWTFELSGTSFEKARIGELTGPLLLTHFGISGPLAFMVSSRLAWEKIDKDHPHNIYFAPIANQKTTDWENFLKDQFHSHPKKTLNNILSEKLSKRFAETFVMTYFSHLKNTFASSISREDRLRIGTLLGDGISLTLLERRPGDEFVTAGGVNTDEIDPVTMESKIQKHLYFAGEVLNVDGYTGGFSLQICWASGYVAGKKIASLLK